MSHIKQLQPTKHCRNSGRHLYSQHYLATNHYQRVDRLLIRLRILQPRSLRGRLALVITIKIRSFNNHQHPADKATNAQTAAMLGVGSNIKRHPIMKGDRVRQFFSSQTSGILALYKNIETLIPSQTKAGAAHVAEEGRYLESILRSFLNKHLPVTTASSREDRCTYYESQADSAVVENVGLN